MKIYSAQLKGTTTVATGSNVSLTGSFTGSIYGFNDTLQYSSSVDSRIVVNSNRLNNIESKSASVDISISNINSVTASNIARLSNLESKSASVDISISNINAVTASNIARLSNLETKSSSVDISITNINSFTASNGNTSLNQLTGSYATTGSNTFFGTQTYSGSVYIANDLVVQGSSSIQYISASSVSIGTNIVQLNTANPSVRFAGLTIIDSGSVGGSGSFLYDSLQDEFIFVHRGNGTNVTSSHFIMGPETYDSLGNETYLTCNRLSKGTGKEHLIDSCISDTGTLVTISSVTSSFSGLVGIGMTAPQTPLHIIRALGNDIINIGESGTNTRFTIGQEASYTGNYINSRNIDLKLQAYCAGGSGGNIHFQTGTDGTGCVTTKVLIDRVGVACFTNTICAPSLMITDSVKFGTITAGTPAQFSFNSTVGTQTTANITDSGNRCGILEIIAQGGTACQGSAIILGADTWGGGNGRGQIAIKALLINGSGCGTSDMAFSLRNSPTCSNFTERMRITSAGNVGIGTPFNISQYFAGSQTSGVLQVATDVAKTATCNSYPIAFFSSNDSTYPLGLYVGMITGATTGARYLKLQGTEIGVSPNHIVMQNDGGNVGIGPMAGAPSEKLHIYGTGSGPEIRMEGTWGSHYIRAYNDNWNFLTNGGRIAIAMNNLGSVFNYQNTTTWQQTSDIRIKENINEISNSLNLIKALKPVSFDYKQEFAEKNNWDDTMKLNNVGFIAQEFETVFPKYVSMNNYTLGDTLIEDFKSIDTGHLVPYIIKAMQEQQCTIDTLKSCLGIN